MEELEDNQIFLTVIIPTYNSEKFIKKCILSVIQQRIQSMEIIVVNDGSMDKTAEIVFALTCKYGCIKLITVENRGVAHARNVGLMLARGRYITFVDSDDYLEPDAYKLMLDKMIKYGVDIVEGACRKEKPDGALVYNCDLYNEIIRGKGQCAEHFLKQKNCCNYMCNKIYKKELFQNHRFPLLRYSEDYFMNALLHKEAASKIILNKVIYHYVIHDKSACGRKIDIGRIDVIKAGVMTGNLFKNTQLKIFPCIYVCEFWIKTVQEIYLQNDKRLLYKFIQLSKRDYRSMLIYLCIQVLNRNNSNRLFTYLLFGISPRLGLKVVGTK